MVGLIKNKNSYAFLICLSLLGLCFGNAARAGDISPKLEPVAKAIAEELSASCPLTEPENQPAFDECRKKLFASPLLAEAFAPSVLWGGGDDSKPFYQLHLTHFDRRIFTGLYLPLFMFPGTYRIDRNMQDFWLQIHIDVSFRNRLMPGEFPYPFWHDANKWNAYEDANEILLRVDPVTLKIVAALRTKVAKAPSRIYAKVTPPRFDGQWMWTDENGKTQPAVTLFDGLISSDNPFRSAMQASYRELALSLRQETCTSCHAPNNPSKMNPLVLMQTPAHAAGEIRRIIAAIERNEMPLTDSGSLKEMGPEQKAELLRKAYAFAEIAEQAFAWEAKPR